MNCFTVRLVFCLMYPRTVDEFRKLWIKMFKTKMFEIELGNLRCWMCTRITFYSSK